MEMPAICPYCKRTIVPFGGGDNRERRRRDWQSQGGLARWQAKCVAAYIEAHLGESFQVSTLARIVELSTSHFSRAFKKSFGETPHDYITRQRVNRAQTIMLNSREPLVKIALDCGMADQSHFGRVFRRVIGVTPAAWRRQFWISTQPPSDRLTVSA